MIFINTKRTTYPLLLTLTIIFLNTVFSFGQESKGHKLWYKQPANSWMKEALPIGNGYLGAMFFVGIEVDIEWSHGKLDKLVLKSDYDQTVKIRYHKMVVYFDLTTGKVMNLDGGLGKY